MSEQQNQQTAALGTAPVGPLLFRLALPTITAQVVNLLYSIVDRIYIGRIPLEGKLALTGMGVTFPVITLISAFAALIGMGGAPRASIALGAKEHDRAERILGTCTAALWALALVLTALFLLFQAPLLRLFGASADTLPYAMQYLSLYVLGTVFVMTSLGLNGFITAQGRSSVAMKTVVIGAVLNTALDPLFIFVLKMGVRGAAVATIISQAVSAAWVLRFLTGKQTVLRLKRAYFRIDRPVLASAVGLGASPFVMQSTESLLTIAFNVSLQRYGGDDYVTSITIITSLMQIVSVLTSGFQQGIQPIIGFNFGARHMERVRQAVRMAFVTQIVSATALVSVLATFPGFFASWFTSEQTVIDIVTRMMPIFVCGWGIFGIQMGAQCALVGMGQAKQSVFLAIFRKIILLVPLALLLPHWIGVNGIFIAEPISDATSGIVAGFLFYATYRKIRRDMV